jgi:hypothetical protein
MVTVCQRRPFRDRPHPKLRPKLRRDAGLLAVVGCVFGFFAATAHADVPLKPDGDGKVTLSGELKQWHKVTLTLNGPFAHELNETPNPFTDYRMTCWFTHESGSPDYPAPVYFAADGDAANSSATAGTAWRAHLSPDKPGKWRYTFAVLRGKNAAVDEKSVTEEVVPFHGATGEFQVDPTDKQGRDLRAHGRLRYVGKRYLQFAGSGQYFLKIGADAPETLLGYADFDGTVATKKKVPLKTWTPHVADWQAGDPIWGDSKGKGLIGAVNYLSSTGCNAFSFLTYNAGGDGDNVWPFVGRDQKLHYDCSKLDQWGVVFDHATARGMYLHFKLQETENDDHRQKKKVDGEAGEVPTSLDGGALGIERKLYCRELVARYGHLLALNWNLGEENSQTTKEQRAMAAYLNHLDPYDHNIVVHTYPDEQDKVYLPLIGDKSMLTGCSLQNSHIKDTHWQTVKWVQTTTAVKKPWIVAFDESGSAAHGQPPDLGYEGFAGKDNDRKLAYTQHEVRKQTLWGVLMGGGAGVEYYFGYKFAQNDLLCEDWRSRDQSWKDCRIAIDFFHRQLPFWEMQNADHLVGNPEHNNLVYCLTKPNELYAIYLPGGGSRQIDLSNDTNTYSIFWYDSRNGGELRTGNTSRIVGGKPGIIGLPPGDLVKDWVCLLRKMTPEKLPK